MSGFFGLGVFFGSSPSGGSAVLGPLVVAAPAGGNNNNFNPASGFPGSSSAPVGRLDLNPPADATLSGLVAGFDGQVLIVRNISAFNLNLTDQDAASTAANRFAIGVGPLDLTAGVSIQMVYYAGTVNRWVVNLG